MKFHCIKLLFLACLFFALAGSAAAQGVISGETSPVVNSTYTYSYAHNTITTTATWSVTRGTVMSQWTSTDKLTTYASIKWTSSGTGTITLSLLGSTIATKTLSVSPLPPPTCPIDPPTYSVAFDSSCGPGSFVINATPGHGGQYVNWYETATGPAFYQGTRFTTPVLSASKIYYIATTDARMILDDAAMTFSSTEFMEAAAVICFSRRVPIQLTVGPVVSIPAIQAPASSCQGPQVFTITGTPGTNGNNIQWFSGPSTTTVLATTTSFTTPALTSPTTYYARSVEAGTGCASARVPVPVTVYPAPGLPGIICEDLCGFVFNGIGQATIGGQPGANANTIRWYSTADGPEMLHQSTSLTTPVLTESTTYYISSYNTTNGCEGIQRKPVPVKIIPYISPSGVRKEIIRVPGVKTVNDVFSLTPAEKTTVKSYFDGLLRTHQEIVAAGSVQGKDIVNPVEYDDHGRTSKVYLLMFQNLLTAALNHM